MINECIQYLEQKLREAMGTNSAGYPSGIFITKKERNEWADSHMGAAIIYSGKVEYCGRPERNLDTKQNDLKVFDCQVSVLVTIGEESPLKLNPIFETFLASLDRGFKHQGHYISIEFPEDAEWLDKKDSIISAEIAVELPVVFRGGIYKPIEYTTIKDFAIERADQNGSQSRNAAGAATAPGN